MNTIILKKNNNGEYVYNSINNIDQSNESKELLQNSNIIQISNENYNDITGGKTVSLDSNINEEKDILIVSLTEDLYNLLINKCKEMGHGDDSEIIIKELLSTIGKKISPLKAEIKDNKLTFTINNSSKNKEEIKEKAIDMSNVNPEEVIAKIKKKVIAQDKAVETIVNNIYNNQMIFDTNDENMINSSKSSILLDGPTGTGKTLIAKEVAKELDIPIITRSATIFSTAGYKGANLTELLQDLLEKAGGNLERAERGIIVLDEFDKLAGDSKSELEMKKAVQQDLLAYIGGGKFPIEYNGQKIEFDTSKITFICMGAFTDLRERKIAEGLDQDGFYKMEPDDYIKEGILRELVGRFSLITSTQSLSRENLKKILTDSIISPLFQLKQMAKKIYDKEITYSDDMIDKIANEAFTKDTGARALATVVNGIRTLVLDRLINSDDKVIEINDELFEKAKDEVKRGVAK